MVVGLLDDWGTWGFLVAEEGTMVVLWGRESWSPWRVLTTQDGPAVSREVPRYLGSGTRNSRGAGSWGHLGVGRLRGKPGTHWSLRQLDALGGTGDDWGRLEVSEGRGETGGSVGRNRYKLETTLGEQWETEKGLEVLRGA